jgi:outer membrane protein OmpA-like peptidoglycan-associated protein
MLRRVFVLSVCLAAMAATVAAQEPDPSAAPAAPATSTVDNGETRPATTTFLGDTGIWFVPTAEVLARGRWSVSAYGVNYDYEQGFTDITHYIGTFGVGVGDRAEIFGGWRVVTRIDRDVRPIFTSNAEAGGLVNEHPFVSEGWTGNQLGDLYLGAKVNFLSERNLDPVALALRGIVKLPTGDDEGAGTGRPDFLIDGIVSKEVNQVAEVSGFGGLVFRSDPDDVDLSSGFRWGFGVAGPTRSPLRAFAELHGEFRFDDSLAYTGTALRGFDGSVPPAVSEVKSRNQLAVGLDWLGPRGVFVGGGVSWSLPHDGRSDFGPFSDESADSMGWQVRIGYHPGVRVYVAPAPPAPPPPPTNRPPTVKARCEPCTVETGKSSTVTADGQDPDGDTLTYKWSAPSGKFANPAERQTLWTAPEQEGSVPVTVTVDDGKGGTASDTVTIQVIRPAVKEFVFEDVHFDFDRYSLREEATRILAEAVKALRENPGLRVQIEGHTCSIGTAEYNLALGERRSHAVRDYLQSNGIDANRLSTVSYGEERPKHDNAREETRRLNRRAALTVRVQ